MRGFQCEYFIKDEKNELSKVYTTKQGGKHNIHNACWASTRSLPAGTLLYIEGFQDEKTQSEIDRLVQTINEITPCKVVTIKNKEYIEFQMLQTYDQSLVLLNFIRNLWHIPGGSIYNITTRKNEIQFPNYTETFFSVLKKSRYKDPLKRLTKANLEACPEKAQSVGHSNVHAKERLKIKSTKDLLSFTGASTLIFLTT